MANTDDQNLEILLTARDNIIEQIAGVTSKPRPNYNIDGQEVSWGDYLKQLQDARIALDQQIEEIQGPWEEETVAYT